MRSFLLIIVLLQLVGCGQSLPPTVPVSGTVTWQDEPLASGTVVFQPLNIGEGLPRRPAQGHLDSQGAFRLSTFRRDDGAVPGEYSVLIYSYLEEPATSNNDQNPGTYVWRIPERYGDAVRSRLTARVPASKRSVKVRYDLDPPE